MSGSDQFYFKVNIYIIICSHIASVLLPSQCFITAIFLSLSILSEGAIFFVKHIFCILYLSLYLFSPLT